MLAITVLFLIPTAQAGWEVVELPVLNWELYKVHFTSPAAGWAVGWDRPNNRGGILHYDGVWKPVAVPDAGSSDWYLTDVQFVSASEGWAVGIDEINRRGLILHYRSGAWVIVPTLYTSTNWNLRGVHFTSADEGWAVGGDASKNRGVLLHYLNGSWITVTPPPVSSVHWELYGVHFTSSNEGWAVGKDFANGKGVLLHYLSGSWIIVTPPTVTSPWHLESVHFSSSGEGWAVGKDSNGRGAMLHYAHGSWTVVVPSVDQQFELFSVHFVSAGDGWAAGYDITNQKSLLLHYLKGAWSVENLPESANSYFLTGLDFTSSDSGWAVGADEDNGKGVILKYALVPVPNISVKPVSVNFGNVRVNTVSKQTLTVQNKGTANLILGTIEPPSSPFTIDRGTCTGGKILVPGNSCSMSVSFTPHATGVSSSQFTISSNDPTNPKVTVNLTGKGVSGPDLTGKWESLVQTCKETKAGTKCKITGSLSVQNNGDQDAKSSIIKFYLSDDEVYDSTDVPLKQMSTGSVKAGKIKAKKFSYNLPIGESAIGKYVIAVIDSGNAVSESDETNNIIYGLVE